MDQSPRSARYLKEIAIVPTIFLILLYILLKKKSSILSLSSEKNVHTKRHCDDQPAGQVFLLMVRIRDVHGPIWMNL